MESLAYCPAASRQPASLARLGLSQLASIKAITEETSIAQCNAWISQDDGESFDGAVSTMAHSAEINDVLPQTECGALVKIPACSGFESGYGCPAGR